jgi:hypothetical protein
MSTQSPVRPTTELRPTPDAVVATDIVSAENDARIYRRFGLPLNGRFMRAGKDEYACQIVDLSVGGASLKVLGDTATPISPGETVIAYIDRVGGLEGPVVRVEPNGFSFRFTATQHKREKLAAQITWLLNEEELVGAAGRRHQRIAVRDRSATLALVGGIFLSCLILDVSVSGASIACEARPDIGTEVYLGRLRAWVVRHHLEGLGLQFAEILEPDDLQVHFA